MRRSTVEANRHPDATPRRCNTPSGQGWIVPAGVELAWTPCHFGGRRPWLVCPRCGLRALRLYPTMRSGLLCRRCAGLAYQVQQVPRYRRLQLAQERIARRLGGTGEPGGGLPEKPPRMHWATYDRHERRYRAAQVAEFADLPALVDRLWRATRRRGSFPGAV
jgi:hypothetical protein